VAQECRATLHGGVREGAHDFQWIEYMGAFRKPEASHGAGARRCANGFEEFPRCRLRCHQ
jgi:hypothetical protein